VRAREKHGPTKRLTRRKGELRVGKRRGVFKETRNWKSESKSKDGPITTILWILPLTHDHCCVDHGGLRTLKPQGHLVNREKSAIYSTKPSCKKLKKGKLGGWSEDGANLGKKGASIFKEKKIEGPTVWEKKDIGLWGGRRKGRQCSKSRANLGMSSEPWVFKNVGNRPVLKPQDICARDRYEGNEIGKRRQEYGEGSQGMKKGQPTEWKRLKRISGELRHLGDWELKKVFHEKGELCRCTTVPRTKRQFEQSTGAQKKGKMES